MASKRTYMEDKCISIHIELCGHVVDLERRLCGDAPTILITIDGNSKRFFPRISYKEGLRVLPHEQVIEHHFMADPLYVLANHTDEDVVRFAAKSLGMLDGPIWTHAYTIPKWLSIA